MRDPSTWRFSHCFPSIAMNEASSAPAREANIMDWTWTAEGFGRDCTGMLRWLGIPEVTLSSIVRTVKLIWL